MAQSLLEARGVIVESAKGGLAVQYITPGVGSSGYYAPEVLSEAAGAGLFPKGMHLYIDHPSASERSDRPERSVRDIGAVSTSPGVWNEEAQAVEANIQVAESAAWLKDPVLRTAIGLSIRASGKVSEGEHDGRRMPIVESLDEVFSVDFVTHAGRGGRFLEAKITDAILASEASANDTREVLNNALKDAYGADRTYVYVEDWDDAAGIVYFNVSSTDADQTYSQTFDATDSGVSLTGSRVEVRRVTNYVPVRAGTEETTEGEIVTAPADLTEAQAKLTEAEQRIASLEAENASLKEAAAKRDLTDSARAFATKRLAESKAPAAMVDRIVSASVQSIPAKDGALDEAAYGSNLDALLESEKAYLAQFQGAPTMFGGGQTQSTVQESGAVTREQSDSAIASAFGRK